MKIFIEVGCYYYNTLYHLLDEGWMGYMIDPIGEYLNKIPNHPTWSFNLKSIYL
jgi:hypothetical protein